MSDIEAKDGVTRDTVDNLVVVVVTVIDQGVDLALEAIFVEDGALGSSEVVVRQGLLDEGIFGG